MLTRTITFENFDGEQVSQTLYFNLSKSELMEVELSTPGGFGAKIDKVAESKDGGQIIAAYKEILKLAYGERSADGKHFRKSDEIWDNFVASQAFDEFFFELITDAAVAADFVNALVPKHMQDSVRRQVEKGAESTEKFVAEQTDNRPEGAKYLEQKRAEKSEADKQAEFEAWKAQQDKTSE